jgi:hypothetical protein
MANWRARMPRWLWFALVRIRVHARRRSLRFTLKAREELAALHLAERDGAEILAELTIADFDSRIQASETGEWMYVFKPNVAAARLYVKLILRGDCVVISFHEEGEGDGD